MDIARQSVSKHIAVLEAAGLVGTVWRGREKLHYLNPAPIGEITERWINQYDRGRVRALADLKRALEEPPAEKPSFVYTTYIRTRGPRQRSCARRRRSPAGHRRVEASRFMRPLA